MEDALEAGAEDVIHEEGLFDVRTGVHDVADVSEALTAKGYELISAPRIEIRYMTFKLRISNICKVSNYNIRIRNRWLYIYLIIISCNGMNCIWIWIYSIFHIASSVKLKFLALIIANHHAITNSNLFSSENRNLCP